MHFLSDGTDELTDADLVRLSQKITSKGKLIELCVTGLDMPHYDVMRTINGPSEISEAANVLLFDWLNGQDNRKIAHKNLCKALRSVNLNLCLNGLKAGQPVKASEDAELCQAGSGQDVPFETTHGTISNSGSQVKCLAKRG